MQSIQDYISRKQSEISAHPFLTRLHPEPALERALWFAPLSAFWAMGFQDVIRLNVDRAKDPELRGLLQRHRGEDTGHEKWFLEDLKLMGCPDLGLARLYGPECMLIRDATYALAGEVFHFPDDRLRVVFLLAIEGAGHVFFEKVARNLRQSGCASGLRYFAQSHLDVELAHDLFEQEVQQQMRDIAMPPDLHGEAIALVDRVFAAFSLMADGLVQRD